MGAAMAIGLGAGLPLARGDDKPKTISVGEIKDGMKGYGLTVFKGTEPERFDVEVIGVLHNFRPSQELILVNTPHPRLNVTKNVKGMSGSPIYLDGRLAGAYAYSWASFQVEPVAGVTPIAPMLTEMTRPIPPGFWPLEGGGPLPSGAKNRGARTAMAPPSEATTRFEGPPGTYDVEAHAQQIGARLGRTPDPSRPLVPAATPLMLGGMSDKAAAYLRKLFEPLGLEPMQAGGGARPQAPDAPQHYVNGGAVGVQLVRGDVSLMGLGTVTAVQGNRLCAFGHPMMNAGNSALPTAIGRVLWIFASDQHSSKIGEAVRPLGAMVQDRQSAIVVDETATAPTFPFTVEVSGIASAPKTSWRTEVAEERFMAPSLAASVLGSVVDATASERRDITWHLRSKLSIRNHGTIELEDFGVAVGGSPDQEDFARSRLVRALGDVLNNPWEKTRIERIESTIAIDYVRDAFRLRGVELLDPIVDAGKRARIRLRLQPFAGAEVSRVIEVPIAAELAGTDVEIEVIPGYEAVADAPAPESLPQLLANQQRLTLPPRSIVAQYKLPSQGVTYRTHVASRLPDFALDTLRPAQTSGGPEPIASMSRTVTTMDRYVEGKDKVKVKVRPVLR
jgi:hypothetical protein